MEEKLKQLIPEEEFNRAKKIAAAAQRIALSRYSNDEALSRKAYTVGLLYNANPYFHLLDETFPLDVCEAIGILNYEKDCLIHNHLNVFESTNPLCAIVRSAEIEVLKNEMD